MTRLLQQAFEKAAALSDQDQDRIARFMIAEIEDEAAWDASFANSQDELAMMAETALAEYRSGRTKPLDPARDL